MQNLSELIRIQVKIFQKKKQKKKKSAPFKLINLRKFAKITKVKWRYYKVD